MSLVPPFCLLTTVVHDIRVGAVERRGRRALYRMTLGPHFSEGARLLWAAIQERRLSQADVRVRVGVQPGTVTRWLYGDKIPSLESAMAIEDAFGIAARRWLEGPAAVFVPPAARVA